MNEPIFHNPADMTLLPHEAKLRMAQEMMKKMPQTYIPVKHFIKYGMCTRVMYAPAGTVIIGKQHLQGQHNFLMQGVIKLIGEDGKETVLHAPEIIVSPPGTKRAAITITDVVWATTLVTDLTDPEEIERAVIHPSDLDQPAKIEKEVQP